jgi:hypothetical protein
MAPAVPRRQIDGMNVRPGFPCLLLAVLASSAHAQDAPDGGWHFLVEPYAMFPNMKGEAGIGNLPPAHVDEDPQDIFDNLQMGAMLFFEARNDRWALSSDLLYMDLEADIAAGALVAGGEVSVSQLGWELAALRRLAPWFELGLGLTYNQIEADVNLEFNGPIVPPVSAGLTEEWIDPTLVARATWPFGEKWFFQARANLGGFGIGNASELNWQLQADVGYRPSAKWRFTFGYRVIDIDYDQGSGADRFVYDVQTFGPVLRLGYSF